MTIVLAWALPTVVCLCISTLVALLMGFCQRSKEKVINLACYLFFRFFKCVTVVKSTFCLIRLDSICSLLTSNYGAYVIAVSYLWLFAISICYRDFVISQSKIQEMRRRFHNKALLFIWIYESIEMFNVWHLNHLKIESFLFPGLSSTVISLLTGWHSNKSHVEIYDGYKVGFLPVIRNFLSEQSTWFL